MVIKSVKMFSFLPLLVHGVMASSQVPASPKAYHVEQIIPVSEVKRDILVRSPDSADDYLHLKGIEIRSDDLSVEVARLQEGRLIATVCDSTNERMPCQVFVLDGPSEEVLDEFVGTRPSVSPDGRFIAFGIARSRYDNQGDLVLLYDLNKSPEENRFIAGRVDARNRVSVGKPLFPEEYMRLEVYDIAGYSVPDNPAASSLTSTLTWHPTKQELVFIVYKMDQSHIVRVNGFATGEVAISFSPIEITRELVESRYHDNFDNLYDERRGFHVINASGIEFLDEDRVRIHPANAVYVTQPFELELP